MIGLSVRAIVVLLKVVLLKIVQGLVTGSERGISHVTNMILDAYARTGPLVITDGCWSIDEVPYQQPNDLRWRLM